MVENNSEYYTLNFQVNRICTDRGVFFTYVDLRWGITSEQTNDGKTIAICLQEVVWNSLEVLVILYFMLLCNISFVISYLLEN